MNTFTITNVRLLPQIGTNAPAMIIDVANHTTGIYRSEKVALIDLRDAGITATRLADVELVELRERFIGGRVSGDIIFHNAGSTYIADANSTAVVSGAVEVGATLKRKADQFRVERFLTISRSDNAMLRSAIAKEAGQAMAQLCGGFVPSANVGASAQPALEVGGNHPDEDDTVDGDAEEATEEATAPVGRRSRRKTA